MANMISTLLCLGTFTGCILLDCLEIVEEENLLTPQGNTAIGWHRIQKKIHEWIKECNG